MADIANYSEQVLASMQPQMSVAPPPAAMPYGPPPPTGMSMAPPPPQGPPIPTIPQPNAHAPAPPPSLQRFAMPPPSADAIRAALAPPAAAAPPPPPASKPAPTAAQEAPKENRVHVSRGAVSPSREIPGIGPTQAALMDRATEKRVASAEEVRDAQFRALQDTQIAAMQREEHAQAQMAGAEAARAKFMQQAQALQDQVHEDTRRLANMKVDPDRYWKNRGALGSVTSALAIALGGFAHGFSGGRVQNMALDIVNRDIDNDIAAQRAGIENARGALDVEKSEFGQLVQRYGMSGAEQMWGAAHAERLAAEAQKLAARNGINEADANYQKVVGELQASADERKAAAIKYILGSSGEAMVFDPRIGVPVPLSKYGNARMGTVFDIEKGMALEGAKAESKKDDDAQKEAAALAKERQQAGLPKSEAIIEQAQKDLAQAPKISASKQVIADWAQKSRFVPGIVSQGIVSGLYDKNEAAREQSHAMVVNQYIHDVTGAGGGPAEMERIQQAAGSAKLDPEARRRFYSEVMNFYRKQEQGLAAGASPKGRALYNQGLRETSGHVTETK